MNLIKIFEKIVKQKYAFEKLHKNICIFQEKIQNGT